MVHGPNIVSQIDNIMSSIIKTLTTSGGSFQLQQACSKVVPAIARYGIEPTTPKEKKRCIIHSLCKPVSDSLLCTQESLSCGVALCLKALVDCVNWRFASDEMVNEVCLKLAGAMQDKPTQTNSHMGLVMSLAEHNSLIVEAYARLLIHAGLCILTFSLGDKNPGRCLTAIQMLHSLMKWLNIRSIVSELELIIVEMGKCQSESDQMPCVKGASFEALQTAKRLLEDKGSKIESDVVSVTGSNFGRSGNRSPLSRSTEPHTLDSFAEYESFMESPISTTQASCNVNHMRKNVNRKLWNQENGCVDVYLKDGHFSELVHESSRPHASFEQDEEYHTRRDYANGFPVFGPRSPANGALRRRTPSPEDNDDNLDYIENQARRHRSPSSTKYDWNPVAKYDKNGHIHYIRQKDGTGDIVNRCEAFDSDSKSVSSTEFVAAKIDVKFSCGVLNMEVKVTSRTRSM